MGWLMTVIGTSVQRVSCQWQTLLVTLQCGVDKGNCYTLMICTCTNNLFQRIHSSDLYKNMQMCTTALIFMRKKTLHANNVHSTNSVPCTKLSCTCNLYITSHAVGQVSVHLYACAQGFIQDLQFQGEGGIQQGSVDSVPKMLNGTCIIDNFCYPYLMIHSTQSQCKSAYFGSRLIFSLCVVQCTWSIEVKLGLILGEGN